MKKAVITLSGGQDSVTTFFAARKESEVVGMIHFQYGSQHNAVELDVVNLVSTDYGIPLKVVTLDALGQVAQSALLSNSGTDTTVPHHLDASLPASFIPGRNLILLTLAAVYAQSVGAEQLWTGVCQTDYSGYPDCRNETIQSLAVAIRQGLNYDIDIITPLMFIDKADTFKLAKDLGKLDYIINETHTCYVGNHTTFHEWGFGCGNCPACQVRAKGWETYIDRYVHNK